ncbi:MAG TPA: PEGA domain-containing protein [Myxococcota bacterium]
MLTLAFAALVAAGPPMTTLPPAPPPPAPAAAVIMPPASAPVDEHAAAPKLVAVLDLKSDADSASLANALATVLASEISARPGYRAVSRNELKSLLAHTADANLLGCQSTNCATDIAKLVDASFVVSGTLGRVAGSADKALVMTLSLTDVAGPAVIGRVDVTWRSDPDELAQTIAPSLDRLFDGAKAASYTGSAELFAPDSSRVLLDGKELGEAPLKQKIDGLAIGVHTLEASGSGYVTGKKDFAVAHNETTVARLTLDEEPYYTQWWFWTAVGGGAVVAIAGGTAIALATLQTPVPDTHVVVKTPLPTSSSAVTP